MEAAIKTEHKYSIHKVLAHSYSVYFLFFLVGVTLDLIFKFKIYVSSIMVPVGLALLILGSILILWAQETSRNLTSQNLTKETFSRGPYSYTRSPTHWGLFFLILGFGIISNALFLVLSTLVAFLITRFVFLEKEELILAQKYGTPYLEYQKIVNL
ncbi:MAG: methyltransferase [Candidatus Paceibacterota bacterium]